MKITGGVLAALLFMSTMALGEQHASYAEPFPQSANPAAYSTDEERMPSGNAVLPAAMAANEDGMITAFSEPRDTIQLGFQFPGAANPNRTSDSAGHGLRFGRSQHG